MSKPVRLQLSRRKGFNLQEHSRTVNGLEAVNCTRPGKWGNPFTVGNRGTADAVSAFRGYIDQNFSPEDARELRGKNLACWCKPGAPCHADVLLDLANPAASEPEQSERKP